MTKKGKKRGILLLIWLILIFVDNAITTSLLVSGYISSIFSAIPIWAIYVLTIATILNMLFAILLFMWKKWAFFAYLAVAGITFVIKLIVGQGIVMSLVGLLFPAILYLIMRSKWDLFK